MDHKEMREIIREQFKKLGYSNRKIGLSIKYGGYSESINATIKDLTIPMDQIKNIVNQFHSVDRDEKTHEILEGGNTYVNVRYDYDIYSAEREKRLTQALEIVESSKKHGDGHGEEIFQTDIYKIFIFTERCHGVGVIRIQSKESGKFNQSTRWVCASEYDVADFLVLYDFQIKNDEKGRWI